MKTLTFRPDGTFTIVQFTDTHISSKEEDGRTYKLLADVVGWDTPDLIVITGDVIHPSTMDDFDPWWRRFVTAMDEFETPWMFVFGNHDAENVPYEKIEAILNESEYGLYESGPADIKGSGNYVVSVKSAAGETRALLWSLDSGMGSSEPSGYDWIREDQLAWFTEQHAARVDGNGAGITNLAFFHIPLPQYTTLWNDGACTGYCFEKVCEQGRDIGQFDAFKGRIDACFVGHEHINDYEGTFEGVDLCYGRGTGYGAYGKDGFPRGARIIKLRESVRGYDSYIRLDDGTLAERPVHEPGA